MDRTMLAILLVAIVANLVQLTEVNGEETILSAVLTPTDQDRSIRQERSYYERYGTGRFNDDRRSSGCGRCLDDRYDDRDDDRGRDRYDDDRRSNRPTYGNRNDRNKNYDNDDDDRRYSNDRNNAKKNGTEDENDTDKKKGYDDDRDRDRPSGGRRDRNRNRHDDRDRYRPDYYDRFLRDPYRDRYERPYYEDSYRERRPYYDRYDEDYGGRYDGYGYGGYRRPAYEDPYNRGSGYDVYGGYGPGVGRGPHDSFRPWDETYRGQAGWDAGGRGYYFASGRPDAPTSVYSRPEYSSLSRPEPTASGWQDVGYSGGYSTGYRDPVSTGYSTGYRNPVDYRGSFGHSDGYRDVATGYGQASGWRNVGERRPYRDQRDPVASVGYSDGGYRQEVAGSYGQASGWLNVGERRPYRDQSGVSQVDKGYNQPTRNENRFNQNRQSSYGQQNSYQPSSQSTTTPATSYLYQREDEQITKTADETTKSPS